jgi:hypothetical protein
MIEQKATKALTTEFDKTDYFATVPRAKFLIENAGGVVIWTITDYGDDTIIVYSENGYVKTDEPVFAYLNLLADGTMVEVHSGITFDQLMAQITNPMLDNLG